MFHLTRGLSVFFELKISSGSGLHKYSVRVYSNILCDVYAVCMRQQFQQNCSPFLYSPLTLHPFNTSGPLFTLGSGSKRHRQRAVASAIKLSPAPPVAFTMTPALPDILRLLSNRAVFGIRVLSVHDHPKRGL